MLFNLRVVVNFSWCCLALVAVMSTGCAETPAADVSASQASVTQEVAPSAVTEIARARQAELAAIHQPTPRPDRIILTWAGDPAHSQAVTWRTDPSVRTALAEIAVAGDNGLFVKRARQLKARTSSLTTDLATAHYHSVEFSALVPDTKYAYRVGDGSTWSEWFHFTTASTEPEPF